MNKTKYIINGRQLCGGHGGVQRYLYEVLNELDKIAQFGEFQIAVPKNATQLPVFKNLSYKRIGNLNGILWEQISFAFYLFLHNKKSVNLCTAVPLLYPYGINAVHDVMILRYREMEKNFKFFYKFFLKLNYFFAINFSDKIITVSNESKNDICNFYKVKRDKVVICQNSWQHMERIISKKPDFIYLDNKNFFLALSSRRWQKNFYWIEQIAKLHNDSVFIIVGSSDSQQKKEVSQNVENVYYIDSLDDGEIKWLYEHCSAFLFPSICEGFGIPPLEALSCGAKIVVSYTSCLPEIYKNYAYYISPYVYNVNLIKLLQHEVWDSSEILMEYSWSKSARILYNLIKQKN